MSDKCFYCGLEAQSKCPDCGLVGFCCVEHFAHHKHEELCQPFVVHFGGEDVGRFLRATRDIKPFEIVLVDRTVALGIFDDAKPVCLSCLEPIGETGSVTCPLCQMPMCNDPKCLESEQHKPECQILSQHKPEPIKIDHEDVNPVYSLIGPLRILRWKSEPIIWKEILSLASHVDERKGDLKWGWVLNRVLPIARACQMTDAELEEIELLFAIARTNALSLYKTSGESPGYALCPVFSLLNHSCMANCRYDMSKGNTHVTVRAARHIPAGEELTIQYKDPLVGNVLSSHSFKNHWMFTCRCPRCSDPTELGSYLSAMRCQTENCKIGFLLPLDSLNPDSEWQCNQASSMDHPKISASNIREAVDRLKFQVDKLTYKDPAQDWENLLQRLLETLHPHHFLVMNAKRMIIQLYGTQVKFEDLSDETLELVNRKLNFCQEYLLVHEKLDAGYSKWRGRIMEEMSTPFIMSILARYKKGEIDKATYMKSYMEGIRMLKEAARCRQYDPRDDTDSLFGLYLRNFNDAIEKFAP